MKKFEEMMQTEVLFIIFIFTYALYSLSREPFKGVPIIWTVHEESLARRINDYFFNNQTQIIHDWKQAFKRATVVVFPNHVLPVIILFQ